MADSEIKYRQSSANAGIVTNLPSPDVSWSIGRNVRFRPGVVYKSLGKSLITAIPVPSAIRNSFMFKDVTGKIWTLVCADAKIYAYNSTAINLDTVTDITPTSPPSATNSRWTFDITGGYPVLSNGIASWYWGMNSSQVFDAKMTLYTVTGSLNITPTATASWMNRRWIGSGMRIGWTGISDIFNTSIDADNTTKSASGRAGIQDLLSPITGEDQVEQVKAFSSMADEMYTFTFRGIWRITPVGSPHDFAIKRLPVEGAGLLANQLHVSVNRAQGGGIYYMGFEDVYVLSGGQVTPLGFPIRNAIFPNLNKAAIATSFAWYNPSTFEVFFCVPTGTNIRPDTAFVYNLETKGWSICDCAYTAQTIGFEANAAQWAVISNSWTTKGIAWTDLTANGIMPFSMVGDSNGNLYKFDGTVDDNGLAFTSYIESGDFGGGNNRIRFNEVIPEFKPTPNQQPVMIQCGSRDNLTQDIDWDTPQQFTPGNYQRKVTSRKEGFYLRLRIYSNAIGSNWILDGYTITTISGGTR